MRFGLAVLVVVAWLGVATPVLAGDGQVEIHQACVAIGCFAGDAPGFPVEIIAPGSYQAREHGSWTSPRGKTVRMESS
jgi:hypothetical protein